MHCPDKDNQSIEAYAIKLLENLTAVAKFQGGYIIFDEFNALLNEIGIKNNFNRTYISPTVPLDEISGQVEYHSKRALEFLIKELKNRELSKS